jgi:predicted RND superfamily exporter protein
LSGLPILRADIVDGLQAEQATLLPIAAVFFLVVLVVVFRRISGTVVPMLAVGVGMAWTVGIMAALG